jgi:hypothetical protein
MTEHSEILLIQLIRVLEDLKDEQAVMHSHRMGKTLAWNDDTGKVLLTIRNSTYLSVNVTVKTSQLWKRYNESRERMGIRHRFYFDEEERPDEVPVRNDIDLIQVGTEMRFLNDLRRNWFKQLADRRMALAMGAHSRLGADSQLLALDGNVLNLIGMLL